eukprot:GILI01028841.1.p1 GENE.GILI01028841.1~~GILI01028841.1.p1  ORF type:complete len:103 (+),score=21.72 GILI01028841.1:56-364(+)
MDSTGSFVFVLLIVSAVVDIFMMLLEMRTSAKGVLAAFQARGKRRRGMTEIALVDDGGSLFDITTVIPRTPNLAPTSPGRELTEAETVRQILTQLRDFELAI